MQLIYKGSDIMPEVSVNKLFYDMYAERRSDALHIRFNDPKSLWQSWGVSIGDEIELVGERLQSGMMYISEIAPENGLYTIRALAMPPKCKTITNKAWQGVKFSKVVEEIAGRHGMSFELYGVSDVTYDYLVQDQKLDIAFLQYLCELEGCALIVHNNKLVVYNEAFIETQGAQGDLYIGIDGEYKYYNRSAFLYDSSVVSSGQYSGSFKTSNETTREFVPAWHIRLNNNEEAKRYAKNLLRWINKDCCTGYIKRDLTVDYAPASMLNLKTERAEAWNGKMFVTQVRHDFVHYKTKIAFRRPLEGY